MSLSILITFYRCFSPVLRSCKNGWFKSSVADHRYLGFFFKHELTKSLRPAENFDDRTGGSFWTMFRMASACLRRRKGGSP